MKSVSTHVLDVSRGKPAAGVPVTIDKQHTQSTHEWIPLNRGATDADGRMKLILDGALVEGTYRITFDTSAYFTAQKVEGFYPEASIVFVVRDAEAHYHVPLLLSPYGYSTYRGS